MIERIQGGINALNAIDPNGFIFLLDSTDRSFIYKSSESPMAIESIISLDKEEGIESLAQKHPYIIENTRHFCAISRLLPHTFFGFFVLLERTTSSRISQVREFFEKLKL